MAGKDLSSETPRQRFERWREHFSASLQGYVKLDGQLAAQVLGDTGLLWQEHALLQDRHARRLRVGDESWDAALRECLGAFSLMEDQGADVGACREMVVKLLRCPLIAPEQPTQAPSPEDLGKLRTSADGSIVASW